MGLFPDNQPISVSQLNLLVKQLLEQNLIGLWVSGEISNLTRASSGHYYFALKDERAQIRCALFKSFADTLTFPLQEGDAVELSGKITLYEARGEYQIVVQEIRQTGAGRLYAAYEALKKRLHSEGLFDNSRKKTLPKFPKTVGIVTSPAAAALRDVVTTLHKRMPMINVIVYPTAVQGKGSEHEIAKAIATANRRCEVDLLIICRGGGSIEDLWAFNEEVVVRAVAESKLPTVSGVGHETDFTLCDFAADMRAPTPTAAAQIAAPDRMEYLTYIDNYKKQMQQILRQRYFNNSQHIDRLEKLLRSPKELLMSQRKRIEELSQQNKINILRIINLYQQKIQIQTNIVNQFLPDTIVCRKQLDIIEKTLNQEKVRKLTQLSQRIEIMEELLNAVAPQKVLQRGFSVVMDSRGKIISSPQRLRLGQGLDIRFAEGTTHVIVAQENKQKDLFD
ncbi:MAG: exodeoxyribonuclease VII large subunit [Neisseriaceae bacterium]|nr:exodeoxyribonuclease VII large subunit [Neisseriaceae bacterium]